VFEQSEPIKVKPCKEFKAMLETEAPLSSMPYLSASCVHFTKDSRYLIFATTATPQDSACVVVVALPHGDEPLKLVKTWTLAAQSTKRAMAGSAKARAASNGHANGISKANGHHANGNGKPSDYGTAAHEESGSSDEEEAVVELTPQFETLAPSVVVFSSSLDSKWLAVGDSNRNVLIYNLESMAVSPLSSLWISADLELATLHLADLLIPLG
jgi:hypothetical protein